MKKLLIPISLFLASASQAQTKQLDTTRAPKIYWQELINLQNVNAELSRRINSKEVAEKISGYRLKGLDTLTSYIGLYLPIIYQRSYPVDTVKKGGKKP